MPEHSTVNQNPPEPQYGDQILVTCKEGYEMSEETPKGTIYYKSQVTRCSALGQWEPVIPQDACKSTFALIFFIQIISSGVICFIKHFASTGCKRRD